MRKKSPTLGLSTSVTNPCQKIIHALTAVTWSFSTSIAISSSQQHLGTDENEVSGTKKLDDDEGCFRGCQECGKTECCRCNVNEPSGSGAECRGCAALPAKLCTPPNDVCGIRPWRDIQEQPRQDKKSEIMRAKQCVPPNITFLYLT